MSRCSKKSILWSLALISTMVSSVVVVPYAFAADEATRAEIVYRANLGRADDVKLLISQGASPDQIDAKGTPIIALASVRNDPEGINVVKTLLELGANINASDPSGQNALFYAAKVDNIPVLKFLLSQKADLQAIDANGDTVRVVAARLGHTDVIAVLDNFVVEQNAKIVADAAAGKPLTQPKDTPPHSTSDGLVPIVDNASKAEAEARIQEAIGAPETATKGQVEEPFEIDEKQLEAAATAPASKNEEVFEAIIQKPVPASAPASKASVAGTDPAAKTPEQIAAETEAAAKAQKIKDEAENKQKLEIKHMAYDVAYHTCAFQYWAYCLESRQSSELSSEEMEIAIETQKDTVEALQKKLLTEYKQPAAFYDNITHSAQVRIYDQLNAMQTNRVRHENGVGKMDDMENRCEEIGRQWGFPANIKPEAPPINSSHGGKNPVSNKPHTGKKAPGAFSIPTGN